MSQRTVRKKPRLNHRFRFQLLHKWLTENFEPCKAADIGGGKGLLSYLLNQSGWDVTVIDPFDQPLPRTFKDLDKNRTTFAKNARRVVNRISSPFEEDMAKDFDILIGLHAHGANIKVLNACAKYSKSFVLLPCCVIDEPIQIKPGIDWLVSLVDYAKQKGFQVQLAELNFKGQNIIICSGMGKSKA